MWAILLLVVPFAAWAQQTPTELPNCPTSTDTVSASKDGVSAKSEDCKQDSKTPPVCGTLTWSDAAGNGATCTKQDDSCTVPSGVRACVQFDFDTAEAAVTGGGFATLSERPNSTPIKLREGDFKDGGILGSFEGAGDLPNVSVSGEHDNLDKNVPKLPELSKIISENPSLTEKGSNPVFGDFVFDPNSFRDIQTIGPGTRVAVPREGVLPREFFSSPSTFTSVPTLAPTFLSNFLNPSSLTSPLNPNSVYFSNNFFSAGENFFADNSIFANSAPFVQGAVPTLFPTQPFVQGAVPPSRFGFFDLVHPNIAEQNPLGLPRVGDDGKIPIANVQKVAPETKNNPLLNPKPIVTTPPPLTSPRSLAETAPPRVVKTVKITGTEAARGTYEFIKNTIKLENSFGDPAVNDTFLATAYTVKAAVVICNARGCDGDSFGTSLLGVIQQESQRNPNAGRTGSRYQGLFQQSRASVASAVKTLERIKDNPNLSVSEKRMVSQVIDDAKDWLAGKPGAQDPRNDPRSAAFLGAAWQAEIPASFIGKDISPVETIQRVFPNDPLAQARAHQAVQLCPACVADGNFDNLDKPLSAEARRAFANNRINANTMREALEGMKRFENISNGVNLAQAYAGPSANGNSPAVQAVERFPEVRIAEVPLPPIRPGDTGSGDGVLIAALDNVGNVVRGAGDSIVGAARFIRRALEFGGEEEAARIEVALNSQTGSQVRTTSGVVVPTQTVLEGPALAVAGQTSDAQLPVFGPQTTPSLNGGAEVPVPSLRPPLSPGGTLAGNVFAGTPEKASQRAGAGEAAPVPSTPPSLFGGSFADAQQVGLTPSARGAQDARIDEGITLRDRIVSESRVVLGFGSDPSVSFPYSPDGGVPGNAFSDSPERGSEREGAQRIVTPLLGFGSDPSVTFPYPPGGLPLSGGESFRSSQEKGIEPPQVNLPSTPPPISARSAQEVGLTPSARGAQDLGVDEGITLRDQEIIARSGASGLVPLTLGEQIQSLEGDIEANIRRQGELVSARDSLLNRINPFARNVQPEIDAIADTLEVQQRELAQARLNRQERLVEGVSQNSALSDVPDGGATVFNERNAAVERRGDFVYVSVETKDGGLSESSFRISENITLDVAIAETALSGGRGSAATLAQQSGIDEGITLRDRIVSESRVVLGFGSDPSVSFPYSPDGGVPGNAFSDSPERGSEREGAQRIVTPLLGFGSDPSVTFPYPPGGLPLSGGESFRSSQEKGIEPPQVNLPSTPPPASFRASQEVPEITTAGDTGIPTDSGVFALQEREGERRSAQYDSFFGSAGRTVSYVWNKVKSSVSVPALGVFSGDSTDTGFVPSTPSIPPTVVGGSFRTAQEVGVVGSLRSAQDAGVGVTGGVAVRNRETPLGANTRTINTSAAPYPLTTPPSVAVPRDNSQTPALEVTITKGGGGFGGLGDAPGAGIGDDTDPSGGQSRVFSPGPAIRTPQFPGTGSGFVGSPELPGNQPNARTVSDSVPVPTPRPDIESVGTRGSLFGRVFSGIGQSGLLQTLGGILGQQLGNLATGGGSGESGESGRGADLASARPPAQPSSSQSGESARTPLLSCSPSKAASGQAAPVVIRWTCFDSNSATLSGLGDDDARVSASGSREVKIETEKDTLSPAITCSNGASRSCSIDVAHPAVSLIASATTTPAGSPVRLIWSSIGVTTCELNGESGERVVSGGKSGSVSVRVQKSGTFRIVCETEHDLSVSDEVEIRTEGTALEPSSSSQSVSEEDGTALSVPSSDTASSQTQTESADANIDGANAAAPSSVQQTTTCNPTAGIIRFTQCLLNL